MWAFLSEKARLLFEVDPSVWTKSERSFATSCPALMAVTLPLVAWLPHWATCSCLSAAVAVHPSRRVKRRRALLASNPPRDSPVEGVPKGHLGPKARSAYPWGLFTPFGHRSHALKNATDLYERSAPLTATWTNALARLTLPPAAALPRRPPPASGSPTPGAASPHCRRGSTPRALPATRARSRTPSGTAPHA